MKGKSCGLSVMLVASEDCQFLSGSSCRKNAFGRVGNDATSTDKAGWEFRPGPSIRNVGFGLGVVKSDCAVLNEEFTSQ